MIDPCSIAIAIWEHRRRSNPRLRRENGGWICVRRFTAVGWGVTALDAYRDWRDKLTRDSE